MDRKRKMPPESSAPCPAAKDDIREAWKAQRDVHDRFVDVAKQGAEVRRISAEMRIIRDRNGFGNLIKKSMGLR